MRERAKGRTQQWTQKHWESDGEAMCSRYKAVGGPLGVDRSGQQEGPKRGREVSSGRFQAKSWEGGEVNKMWPKWCQPEMTQHCSSGDCKQCNMHMQRPHSPL